MVLYLFVCGYASAVGVFWVEYVFVLIAFTSCLFSEKHCFVAETKRWKEHWEGAIVLIIYELRLCEND
eukprot:scaffold5146_cov164-Ochromonas_danica.AAC.14